ncbi:MAG TPA: hypothetical protein VG164_15455 [Trebonia sp.]|nr:hypothetical protein [Trebonia sp.]
MNGTWQTTGGGGAPAAGLVAVSVAAAVVGAAVAAWIITKMLLIVLIALALLVIAVMVVLVVRRIRHPEGAVQIARPAPALAAEVVPQAVEARPAAAGVTYHGGTHVHIEAGADEAAALIRNSIAGIPIEIREN